MKKFELLPWSLSFVRDTVPHWRRRDLVVDAATEMVGKGVFSMGFFDWLAAQLVQSPDPSFLTDLLGIVTVLLGIVVPLTFSVVAKISEEFQSPMILKDFGRRLPVKAFFRLLIFDAVLLILLKFFVSDTPHTDYWIGLAWFSLVLSLVTFGLGAVFFKLAWQYSSDTEFLLNRFVSNAKKVL